MFSRQIIHTIITMKVQLERYNTLSSVQSWTYWVLITSQPTVQVEATACTLSTWMDKNVELSQTMTETRWCYQVRLAAGNRFDFLLFRKTYFVFKRAMAAGRWADCRLTCTAAEMERELHANPNNHSLFCFLKLVPGETLSGTFMMSFIMLVIVVF